MTNTIKMAGAIITFVDSDFRCPKCDCPHTEDDYYKKLMTQEEIDKVYTELAAYEKEIADYNQEALKSLGKKAQNDFEELLDCCNVTEKIELVDAPKGHDNKENCGVFKNVHVEQWTTNMEGDSYAGFIYANVKGRWIKVPFSC